MAHLVEVHDNVIDMTVTFSGTPASANDPVFVELDRSVRSLKQSADLKDLVIAVTAPGIVSYSAEHDDGRMIAGSFDFSADVNNPKLTGATTGAGWTISELAPFRAFRDAFARAHRDLGTIALTVAYF